MPDMVENQNFPTIKGPNVFDLLVSQWDEDALKKVMGLAEDSIPTTIPLSFRFIDQIRHYNCRVFRAGHHFFLGGCQVEYKILPLQVQRESA